MNQLNLQMLQQLVVPEVEVGGELAGLEPDQGSWQSLEYKRGDRLRVFGCEPTLLFFGDDEVEQVFLAFELISISSQEPGKLIRFDADAQQGELVGGSIERGIKHRKFDPFVVSNALQNPRHDLVATLLLDMCWVHVEEITDLFDPRSLRMDLQAQYK